MQKCKGMRERDNSRTTPAIHRKALYKKKGGGGGVGGGGGGGGGAFFTLYKLCEN